MPLHPQARITVELTSTRRSPYRPDYDPTLEELNFFGSDFIEEQMRELFGDSLDSLTVTATHSLVEPAAA